MSTICFVSSKGGTGKTTAALLLALGVEDRGLRVAMIDCDPNLPLFSWRRMTKETAISVFPATTVEEMQDLLPLAKARADFVIVDTEGSVRARRFVQSAQADVALIPVGPSMIEAVEAIRTSEFLKTVPGRRDPFLPHGVLLTRTPAALKPRSLTQVVAQMKDQKISMLETAVVEKEVYRQLFAVGGTLRAMTNGESRGQEAAQVNAAHYANCVLSLFGNPQPRRPAAPPPPPRPNPAADPGHWGAATAGINIKELEGLLPKSFA